jgi:hypothetical protein
VAVLAGSALVSIDIEALLRGVVTEAFDADVDAVYSTGPREPHVHGVRLTDPTGDRRAGLRASYEWFTVTLFDLRVSTGLFDYDDDEEEKRSALRALALVARAYLCGEGVIEQKRGLLRSHPVFRVDIEDHEWRLGRRWGSTTYPD